MTVWHLLTQWHRRCQSDARNRISRLSRRDLHTIGHISLLLIGAKVACVDAAGMTLTERQDQDEGNPIPVVQCDCFFFKSEKDDIMCKAISAIDSVYNRTMALECEFKGLSYQAVPKWLKVLSETVKLLSLPTV